MKNLLRKNQSGFTLIELLVVIAILAVLAVAVVIVLNPAELIKQARDSTRISDMAAINSAIAFYLSSVAAPATGTSSGANCTSGTTTNGTAACSLNASTTISGGGWVTINFGSIPTGSPIAKLPIDPNNGSTNCQLYTTATVGFNCFYEYLWNNASTTYQLDSAMESQKYSKGGTNDVETNDGGPNTGAYEVGNAANLAL